MEPFPPSTSTIEDLPNELLVPILKQVPYKDRNFSNGVSVRWRGVVDKLVGRKLFIGTPPEFTPLDEQRYQHRYVDISTIEKIGVCTCYVGEVEEQIENASGLFYLWLRCKKLIFGKADPPTFKYCYLVQQIYFNGSIPPNYFDAFIRPLFNLKRLDIHISSMCSVESAQLADLKLYKLETLNLWGYKLTQNVSSDIELARKGRDNICTLFKNRFPKLKHLAFEFPFELHEQVNLTRAVLGFLKSHCSTIVKLRIEINRFFREENSRIESDEEIQLQKESGNVSSLLRLKSFEFMLTSLFSLRDFKVWVQFIEQQKSLSKFSGLALQFDLDIFEQIANKNFETLTHILVTRLVLYSTVDNRMLDFDCSVLANCSRLESLILEGLRSHMDRCAMEGVNLLPKSLQKIDICGIPMSSQVVRFLTTELPKLKELVLAHIGHRNGLGVTTDILAEVIQKRQIKLVSIFESINWNNQPPSPVRFFNGDDENPINLELSISGLFEIKLGVRGFYEKSSSEYPGFPTTDVDDGPF